MSTREAACLIAGLLVGGSLTYLGVLTHDYWRAFWRAPSHNPQRKS